MEQPDVPVSSAAIHRPRRLAPRGAIRGAPGPAAVRVVLVAVLHTLSAVAVAAPPAAPNDREIAPLIRQLGDRSYPVRASASRRLCMIGPAARPALETAARSRDFEVALRARALLDVFDQLLFAGCEIEIDVSKRSMAWNEPIDLVLVVRNRSAFAATVPFDVPEVRGAPSSPEAAQVAGLLDVADFLKVIAPDGAPVSFHVDVASVAPSVEAIVRARADSSPSGRLEPGQSVRHRISKVNRGWARYPMLREGAYRITLAYEPRWDDAEFTRAGVGALRSNTVEIVITQGAPRSVVGPGASPTLVLVKDQAAIVARLQNRQDVPIWLNTNFGSTAPPFASFRWLVYVDDQWRDYAGARAARGEFSPEMLIEVAPGERFELGRADLTTLRKSIGLKEGEPLFVRASYTNLCDRAWQRKQKTLPAALQVPLPDRLLFTTLTGEPLRID